MTKPIPSHTVPNGLVLLTPDHTLGQSGWSSAAISLHAGNMPVRLNTRLFAGVHYSAGNCDELDKMAPLLATYAKLGGLTVTEIVSTDQATNSIIKVDFGIPLFRLYPGAIFTILQETPGLYVKKRYQIIHVPKMGDEKTGVNSKVKVITLNGESQATYVSRRVIVKVLTHTAPVVIQDEGAPHAILHFTHPAVVGNKLNFTTGHIQQTCGEALVSLNNCGPFTVQSVCHNGTVFLRPEKTLAMLRSEQD